MQRIVENRGANEGGAYGLHLYPRTGTGPWPYGCDGAIGPNCNGIAIGCGYETWARYAWNSDRSPDAEKAYWIGRLAEHFRGPAAPHVLGACEESADVLPASPASRLTRQRRSQRGASSMKLDQLPQAAGCTPSRCGAWSRVFRNGLTHRMRQGKRVKGKRRPISCRVNWPRRVGLPQRRTCRPDRDPEQGRSGKDLGSDMQAVAWVVRFYRDKLRAGRPSAVRSGIDRNETRSLWLGELRASVDDFGGSPS